MTMANTNDSDGVDPITVFSDAGVLEANGSDEVRLVDTFRERLIAHVEDVREGDVLETCIRAELSHGEPVSISTETKGLLVEVSGGVRAYWPSRAAAVADFAADRTLHESSNNWQSLPLTERSRCLRALRGCLSRCPECEDYVARETTRNGCPPNRAKLIVHCPPCGSVLFQSAPHLDLPDTPTGDASSDEGAKVYDATSETFPRKLQNDCSE